ncbi:hypothetical protein [Pseudomonas mosselii]|uniref:hypothetical protein n=1 Tax=Pseudomonas mosselii TaxID=78327 RepID=UPI002162FD0A|nr:hypothetical protein [Pseudomonas mosselii]UVN43319.1 hypothetical protein NW905_19695 [Pseudomonas mosselii]
MKVHEVFGIQPTLTEHSYVDRGNLDRAFTKLLQRQQTHIAIRGASKSGKSWLRQRVLKDPIIVQCRFQYTTLDIYRDALARLDIRLEVEQSSANKLGGKITASGEAGFKLIAKVQGAGEVNYVHENSEKTKAVGKDTSDLEFIAALIRESGRTLVIEDFHYLPEAEQRKFAFDLKTLWDYRTFVVVVGVWISSNMLITLNPDLSDRMEELSVTWSTAELCQVLNKGCNALNLRMKIEVSSLLAEISYGSVGLLQKLTLRYIDDELDITEGGPAGSEILLDDSAKVQDAAMHVADQLNQLYQTFARQVSEGIRTRANATGIYAHAMAAIMDADDLSLTEGLSAKTIHRVAHARQKRIQLPNLKSVLIKFPELQVDADGRGLVLAYDSQNELVSVVDRQLLLYRRYATVRWPWEEIITEIGEKDEAYQGN